MPSLGFLLRTSEPSLLLTFRYSDAFRRLIWRSFCTLVACVFLLGLTQPQSGPFPLLILGTVVLSSVLASLFCAISVSVAEPALPQVPNRFEDLEQAERYRALSLAWAGGSDADCEVPRFEVRRDFAVGVLYFVLIVVLPNVLAAVTPAALGEQLGLATYLALLAVGSAATWLLFPLSYRHDGKVAFRRYSTAVQGFQLAFVDARLRTLAVTWVNDQNARWTAAAVGQACRTAIERLGLPDEETQKFPLLVLESPGPQGMPDREVQILVLLVGNLLGIRSGYRLRVEDTSFAAASGKPWPVTTEKGEREFELYFRDIVTVTYERSESSRDGPFVLSVVDGQKIGYQAFEAGTASAIDAIRRQTRAAKACP